VRIGAASAWIVAPLNAGAAYAADASSDNEATEISMVNEDKEMGECLPAT
jgi:hypothetical protein